MGIFRGYILGRTWKRIEEPCKQGSTVQLGPTSRGGWSSVGSASIYFESLFPDATPGTNGFISQEATEEGLID